MQARTAPEARALGTRSRLPTCHIRIVELSRVTIKSLLRRGAVVALHFASAHMRIQCLSVRPPAGFIMRNYIALTTKWNFGARVSWTHSQPTTHGDAKRHRQRLQRLLSNLELSQPLLQRDCSSASRYSCCIPFDYTWTTAPPTDADELCSADGP